MAFDMIPATPASRWSRLGAFLIDQVIGLVMLGVYRVAALSLVGALAYLAIWAFVIVQTILVSHRGQTIGKLLLSIAIVDRIDKTPPGFVRAAILRQLPIMFVSLFFPTLSVIVLLADSAPMFLAHRRCIHDYVAGTVVIKAPVGEPIATVTA